MSSVKWESYLLRIVDIWCSRWFTTAMKWSSPFFADSPDSLTESQRYGFVLLSLSPPFGPLDVKLVKKTRPAPRYTSKKAHRNDLSRAIAWIACWRPWCWWTARRETVFVDVYTQVWLPTRGVFQSWILIMKWKQQFFVVPIIIPKFCSLECYKLDSQTLPKQLHVLQPSKWCNMLFINGDLVTFLTTRELDLSWFPIWGMNMIHADHTSKHNETT